MGPPSRNTTKLPKQLADEIGHADWTPNGRDGKSRNWRSKLGGRKERRKADREQNKTRRHAPQSRLTGFEPHEELESADEDDSELDQSQVTSRPLRTVRPEQEPLKSALKVTRRTEPNPSKPPRLSKGVKDRLAQDEAEIAFLEKKLGTKGKKKLPKSFKEDGLDELLDGLDGDDEIMEDSRSAAKRRRMEGEDWLERKRKKARGITVEVEDVEDEKDDSLSEDGKVSKEMNSGDQSDANDVGDFAGFDSDDSPPWPAPRPRENPYIAPSTSKAAPYTKYIPPSLRGPSSSETEALARLRRQAQGLLNRLSEANLLSILKDVEQLYSDNARQHVTSTLIDLLLTQICDHAILQDTFLILHAGFIAAIYKVSGNDFGAAMTQRAIEDFDRFYAANAGGGQAGKEPTNLISLLAELYNFQVIASNLVFDLIRVFLSELSELNTELLLKIIQNSGPQLRHDDPSALKDIVLMLQPAVARLGEANISVRTKFMIEMINSLKNNRMKTGAAASAVTSEATIRMKKILGSLNTRTIRATEPLHVGLNDVRVTDKRGKWWLVGASWKDNASGGAERTKNTVSGNARNEGLSQSMGDGPSDLLQLAKEHRMNTDVRRAIFVTIMSASDYRDAHMRLTKLRLKRAQELEIPRVLMHCSGAEQSYNPYYALIARRLCTSHKLRMAFQFGLWDLFKGMGEGEDEALGDVEDEDDEEGGHVSMRKMVHLSKMFGAMIAGGGLGLNMLKHLNLAYLQPKTKTFVELLLITVLLQSQPLRQKGRERDEKAVAAIFSEIKDDGPLARGLQYFLKRVVGKTDVAGSNADRDTVRWGCRVAINTLRDIAASTGVAE